MIWNETGYEHDLVQEGTLYKFAQESVEQDKILVYESDSQR